MDGLRSSWVVQSGAFSALVVMGQIFDCSHLFTLLRHWRRKSNLNSALYAFTDSTMDLDE